MTFARFTALRSLFLVSCTFASLLTGCGSSTSLAPAAVAPADPAVISISSTSVQVPTLSSEDLAGPCAYDLLLPPGSASAIAGTLVVFDRGDSNLVYGDATFQAMAARLHYAMVFAHQCNAKSSGDLQADATQGPARTLVAAMGQFAINTSHPELENGGWILYGFSAAGVLSATMTNAEPTRVTGAILFAPGDQYTPLNSVSVSAEAAKVPMLILGNAQDAMAGTTSGLYYFNRGRNQAAPWAFGVQRATGHCCNTSTLPMIEPWIAAVAGGATSALNAPSSSWAQFACPGDASYDAGGTENCSIYAPVLVPVSGVTVPSGPVGWLPNQSAATAWLAWVTNPTTN